MRFSIFKKLLFIIFLFVSIKTSIGQEIDSLENLLSKTASDNEKYSLLIEIGQKNKDKSPQVSMTYYRQALDLSKKLGDSSKNAEALFNLAAAYDISQKYKQSLELYKKSLNIYKKLKDSINIANLYKNIGSLYLQTSVYDSSLYYELGALRIYQRFGNYYGIMDSYMILGTVSTEIENFIEAEYYFEQAMNFADETNNLEYKCLLYNNIGRSFYKQNIYNIAIENYKLALGLAVKYNKEIYLGDIYQNIANAYLQSNQLQISLAYFYKAKEYYEKFNNISGIFNNSIGLAKMYYNSGYYRISYGYLLKDLSLIKNYNSYLNLKNKSEFYDVYSKILYKIDEPIKAYNALRKKEELQDSFFGEKKMKLVYELEYKYQTISKNKTIENLQEINKLNQQLFARTEATRRAERKQAFLLVFIGVISLIFSSIVYWNFLKNRKLSKKIAEKNKKIFEAQEKLKRIVDFLPVAFFEFNSNGKLVFKNKNFSDVTSINEDTGDIKFYFEYIKSEYKDVVLLKLNELISTHEIQTVEFEFVRKDKTSFWALMTMALNIFNDNYEYYGMIIDISERKKIEQDLSLLKTSVEQSETALMITDFAPKIVFVNPAYLRITGYKKHELLGKNPSILSSGLTPKNIYIDFWDTISSGNVWKGVFSNKKKNGQIYSEKTLVTPVIDRKGKITHYIANKEDITEEMIKNEKILKLFTATENSPNSVMILDEEMKIAYVNKAFEKITGYKADEVYGLTPSFLDSKQHTTEVVKILKQKVYNGELWQGMLINVRKNGEEYWSSSTVIPLRNEDDKLIAFVCNDIDITPQIKTQEELMDTMDQLNEKNEEIMSSIRYAERIQKVMISNELELKELFPQSFVVFMPRDIISGDFFWVSKVKENYYAAVVDCTGHSVPGAFLSIIGVNLLDSAINERKIKNPSDVLQYMSQKLHGILSNPYSIEHIKDDMEVALTRIDYVNKNFNFASSRNRLYFVSENSKNISSIDGITEILRDGDKKFFKINGDRKFLGSQNDGTKFKNYTLNITDGDILYFSSDGYYDQFGEKENVKYKRVRFERKLLEISSFSVEKQKEILITELKEFKGKVEQTDDITVLGIKIDFSKIR